MMQFHTLQLCWMVEDNRRSFFFFSYFSFFSRAMCMQSITQMPVRPLNPFLLVFIISVQRVIDDCVPMTSLCLLFMRTETRSRPIHECSVLYLLGWTGEMSMRQHCNGRRYVRMELQNVCDASPSSLSANKNVNKKNQMENIYECMSQRMENKCSLLCCTVLFSVVLRRAFLTQKKVSKKGTSSDARIAIHDAELFSPFRFDCFGVWWMIRSRIDAAVNCECACIFHLAVYAISPRFVYLFFL